MDTIDDKVLMEVLTQTEKALQEQENTNKENNKENNEQNQQPTEPTNKNVNKNTTPPAENQFEMQIASSQTTTNVTNINNALPILP